MLDWLNIATQHLEYFQLYSQSGQLIERMNLTLETILHSKIVELSPENNKHLLNLCGRCDEHIRLIEDRLEVHIKQRGFTFSINGHEQNVDKACAALTDLYNQAQKDRILAPYQVHLYLQTTGKKITVQNPTSAETEKSMEIRIKRGAIIARGENQVQYLQNIFKNDINFGIGSRMRSQRPRS
jgi:phosphate starvation-inducible PhoH-like protein